MCIVKIISGCCSKIRTNDTTCVALTDVRGQTALVRVFDFDITIMIDMYSCGHWLAKGEKANYYNY